jgi:hypothetical protein
MALALDRPTRLRCERLQPSAIAILSCHPLASGLQRCRIHPRPSSGPRRGFIV